MEDLKKISELIDYQFVVDAYQRGYRWDTTRICNLLSDITEFNEKQENFYCLQPLVVNKLDERKFELIDGQQRCTSIFLILTYFRTKNFTLTYTTRNTKDFGSEDFLKDISNLSFPDLEIDLYSDNFTELDKSISQYWQSEITKSNREINTVDNFYFYRAYTIIKNWFDKQNNEERIRFKENLLHKTKVIWYVEQINKGEENNNVINKFINFNEGKIELEQAELIKALFVLDINKTLNLTQRHYIENQFADEWNSIEHQMQDKKFWNFVSSNKKDDNVANKINLLFQLDTGFGKPEDLFFNYRNYDKKFKQDNESDRPHWNKITQLYNSVEEWFYDRNVYHLIGAIIHLTSNNISKILELSEKSDNKDSFKQRLQDTLKKHFLENDNAWKKTYNPQELKYGDNKRVFDVLFLYNIALTDAERKDDFFPFYRFKATPWNIEHILAKNDDGLTTPDELNNFLKETDELFENIGEEELSAENRHWIEELLTELETAIEKNDDSVAKSKAKEIFLKLDELLNVNNFDNLCLLDNKSNIKVGKKPFRTKRNILFGYDNNIKIDDDAYIPIGTEYVFAKKTTNSSNFQINYWSSKDRELYLNYVNNTISQFLNVK